MYRAADPVGPQLHGQRERRGANVALVNAKVVEKLFWARSRREAGAAERAGVSGDRGVQLARQRFRQRRQGKVVVPSRRPIAGSKSAFMARPDGQAAARGWTATAPWTGDRATAVGAASAPGVKNDFFVSTPEKLLELYDKSSGCSSSS